MRLRRRRSSGSTPAEFERAIVETVQAAAAPAVEAGTAQVAVGADAGGRNIRLEPTNDGACEVTVYFDYPTVALSDGTTELFGTETARLHELQLLVEAVIAGRYEWEFGVGRMFGVIPLKRFRGTFHTDEGPWTFTRWGASEEPEALSGNYEPYGK
jgi:hypothetical protein